MMAMILIPIAVSLAKRQLVAIVLSWLIQPNNAMMVTDSMMMVAQQDA